MEKDFNFEINGRTWKIREVEFIKDSADYIGETQYQPGLILMLQDMDEALKRKTLKHELTHVWMWEYGHNQHEKEYNNEDVCEIVANSNDFINRVVSKYFEGGRNK